MEIDPELVPPLERWLKHFSTNVDPITIIKTVNDLAAHYQNPMRSYHTLVHVEHIHRELEPVQDQLEDSEGVSLATDVHDIIQEPKVGGDEEASLKWAQTTLDVFGIPKTRFTALAPCVMATKHKHEPPEHSDARYFADADLAIFGQSHEKYLLYRTGVRFEYTWVPEVMWRRERAKVLRGFLDRPYIYWTDHFRNLYEETARHNLEQEIAMLQMV